MLFVVADCLVIPLSLYFGVWESSDFRIISRFGKEKSIFMIYRGTLGTVERPEGLFRIVIVDK